MHSVDNNIEVLPPSTTHSAYARDILLNELIKKCNLTYTACVDKFKLSLPTLIILQKKTQISPLSLLTIICLLNML